MKKTNEKLLLRMVDGDFFKDFVKSYREYYSPHETAKEKLLPKARVYKVFSVDFTDEEAAEALKKNCTINEILRLYNAMMNKKTAIENGEIETDPSAAAKARRAKKVADSKAKAKQGQDSIEKQLIGDE